MKTVGTPGTNPGPLAKRLGIYNLDSRSATAGPGGMPDKRFAPVRDQRHGYV